MAETAHGQTNASLANAIEPSPFFHTPAVIQTGSLAILHLRKDSLVPVTLGAGSEEGYAEGAVTNTRFGSFPHSTLLGLDWGSQVRASKVDTGSKGRKPKQTAKLAEDEPVERKRKADDSPLESSTQSPKKLKQSSLTTLELTHKSNGPAPTLEAGSGFVHILPPTPEAWTASLSHRTQVVYTPDYSYILQRLRVRPGNTIIEAGAGSGSFTHAAARAVFNGYADPSAATKQKKFGRVYSYEYHEPRVETLRQELRSHALDSVVQLTYRDVCTDGFTLETPNQSAQADAVFLDLPAPWLAIKHLSRSSPQSPLNPTNPVHLCTFSPCIEQVMATVSTLRKSGWTEIDMVEVSNKRIDVRREQVGLKNEGLRGVNPSAASVDEAVGRLREVESKFSDFHTAKSEGNREGRRIQSKAERLQKVKEAAEGRKLYLEGQVVHRTEPEVKTHTSYLVFATLPRAWSEERLSDEVDGAERHC